MDRSGVEYEEINIDKNPDYIPFLKDKGIASAPVIFYGNDEDSTAGFQPEKIKEVFPIMESYNLIAIFPVGYPEEDAKPSHLHNTQK